MKKLGDVISVYISKLGELHLRVSNSLVMLGAEFKRLMVFHPAKLDCAFYGVGSQGASLTVVFQFFVPGSRRTDNSISLHCRLPALDTGSS
ncbi:hypothetical protein Nepgr_022344 [Nepenthes gracilis]|uniref:Uncharacterized protein n=1 Tax=Nepenthes gracilis TaxID=150966 RepID=A0AAD3XWW1_NEPGR|nr:hypothetical protein Nepgr_022344 [Nepenthes gracilis]